jgi:anti-sigma factor RsiW
VNCALVRDRLPERALGTLDAGDSTEVDRHLQWCAACRKEDGELGRAATTLAFSVPPAEPDPSLEARVVAAVQRRAQSGPSGHVSGRRGRLAVAAVAAAMMAVSGLGWGAVMAGKAARSEAQAKQTIKSGQDAAALFRQLLTTSEFNNPDNEVLLGSLVPAAGTTGGGSAFTLVSPSLIDMAVVMVTGLPPASDGSLPYTVRLSGPNLQVLTVGRIRALDAGGAAMIAKDLDQDLNGYNRVVVRNARGKVVMQGRLATGAALASPTP